MARDTSTAPAFGQTASDYVPSDNGDDIWIRTFKKPMTLIRICPAEAVNEKGKKVYGPDAWPTEREHYVEGLGSFPCAVRFGLKCGGCEDPSEKVQEKRRQYYINALDEEGELRVFKMGVKLFQTFQARHERSIGRDPENRQPLSDKDYMINRMGKGLETTYDPEPGESYEVDWPEELHDIPEILKERYLAAKAYYDGDDDGAPAPSGHVGSEEDEPAPASRPLAKKAAAKKTAPAAAKKAAAPEPEPEPEEEESDEIPEDKYGPLGATPSDDDIEDATSEDLKTFLNGRKVEFPARAARSRLVDDAKKVAAEPPY